MAWIDDRIWCHPKFTSLPASAAWVYVKGVAYSSGMSTGGLLDNGAQRMLGATETIRTRLVAAGLWDEIRGKNGKLAHTVEIHDWGEHNARRDERRRKDRERKRAARKGAT